MEQSLPSHDAKMIDSLEYVGEMKSGKSIPTNVGACKELKSSTKLDKIKEHKKQHVEIDEFGFKTGKSNKFQQKSLLIRSNREPDINCGTIQNVSWKKGNKSKAKFGRTNIKKCEDEPLSFSKLFETPKTVRCALT